MVVHSVKTCGCPLFRERTLWKWHQPARRKNGEREREARTMTALRRENRERGAGALTHQKPKLIFEPSERALIFAAADTVFSEGYLRLMIACVADFSAFFSLMNSTVFSGLFTPCSWKIWMPYLHGISLPPVPSRRNCKPFRYLDGGICRDFSMTALQSVILLTVISNQYLAEATPQSSFLQDVLRFYGENESLSTDNLNNFLQLITTRRPPSIDNEDNPLKNTEVVFLIFSCCLDSDKRIIPL